MRKELIGHVGVDSGQLMIVDPCYIDSHWKHTEFIDIRRYRSNGGDDQVYPDDLVYPLDFTSYEQVISRYGKTMNQLISEGIYTKIEDKASSELSYNGACQTSLHSKGCGVLDIGLTHAVVFRSGYGDGVYPVYAYYNKDNRITKVVVIME